MSNAMDNVKAIILAGSRDFGRCALASQLPAPLWPVDGRPAIIWLLSHLAEQGIKSAVVCGGQDTQLYKDVFGGQENLKVSFLYEPLPVGTAGCIRDAADGPQELLLIMQGAMISPPSIEWLLTKHFEKKI